MSVNKLCSKLIIGTANFNQKYGIANNFKSISKKEIKKIIKLAYLNKIYTFILFPSIIHNNTKIWRGKWIYDFVDGSIKQNKYSLQSFDFGKT